MAEHTPGPWTLADRTIEEDGSIYPAHILGGARELVICSFSAFESDAMFEAKDDCRSKRANAALICASPDLLAACIDLVGLIAEIAPAYEQSTMCANARAAIEKAAGRASPDLPNFPRSNLDG